jgi:hypothetical protein
MPLLFHIEQKPLGEQPHQQHPAAAAAIRPVAMRGEGRTGLAVDGDEAGDDDAVTETSGEVGVVM